MIYKCANAYYFRSLNKIGGIESHLYYISKKYGDLDITIFYKNGDQTQIDRLKQTFRCKRLKAEDKVICEKIFCCFNREILDQCEAKEKFLVLHGDYGDMLDRGQITRNNLPIDDRIDKYIGVSQTVCDSWKRITGFDAENVYQPVVLEDCGRPLLFGSATRLTREKGWERMLKLADILDENNVNYTWLIFTDTDYRVKHGLKPRKNMIFCEPRLDITDKLGMFDAYIQLSDNEGFCLSVVEALLRNTPIICTDIPVFRELGLNDTNSIKLDLDMKKIPVEKIRNIDQLKFTYTPPKDRWDEYLVQVENPYDNKKVYKVRALDSFKKYGIVDVILNRIPEPGEFFDVVGDDRMDTLLGDNFKHEPFVRIWKEEKGAETDEI